MIAFYDMVQGSPGWRLARKGRPTGSEFDRICTAVKGEYASGAEAFAAELIAASLGWEKSFKGSPDTERGHQLEKQAVRWLGFDRGLTGRDVGFCLSDCGRYGCSPDWIVDDGSPTEIKAPDIHTYVKWWQEWKRTKSVPNEHKVQCHAEMLVTGADRCIFVPYPDHECLPRYTVDVRRDAFTDKLKEHVDRFCDYLDQLRLDLLAEEAEFYQPATAEQIANASNTP